MNISKKHLKHEAYKTGQMPIEEFKHACLKSYAFTQRFDLLKMRYKYSYSAGINHCVVRDRFMR